MLNRSQPRTAGGNLPLLPESVALSGSFSCSRLFNFEQKASPPSLVGSVSAAVSTQHSRAVTVQKAVLQHAWGGSSRSVSHVYLRTSGLSY